MNNISFNFCLKYSFVVYITKFNVQIPTFNYSV